MFTVATYPYNECPPAKKCRNTQHGNIIIKGILRYRGNDGILAKFVAKSCRDFNSIIDDNGMTAIHAAAAAGRPVLVEWLLNNSVDPNIRSKDGQTPIHQAFLYGHVNVAVLLLQYGANLDVLDHSHRFPLGNLVQITQHQQPKTLIESTETFASGSNKNYNLGLGNVVGSSAYQPVEFFNKMRTSVTMVAISPYHCLFLTQEHKLFVVGHGNENQLGIGKVGTLVVPQHVKLTLRKQDYVKDVSVSRHHSMVLTNKGHVYTCGSNKNNILGHEKNPTLFREVEFFDNPMCIQGIAASQYHSIAYNRNVAYVWGVNVGQFGPKGLLNHLTEPVKLTTYGHPISRVASNDAAIAVYTDSKNILLYHNFKIRTLRLPTYEGVRELVLSGGIVELDDKSMNAQNSIKAEELKLLICTDTGEVYVWTEDVKRFIKCIMSLNDDIKMSNLLLHGNRLTYIALGFVFSGDLVLENVRQEKNNDPMAYQLPKNDQLCTDKVFRVAGVRVPLVDNAEGIFCDEEGKSFILLQSASRRFVKIPEFENEAVTYKSLMVDATEDDGICDIVFHVDDDVFLAHKFLIFSRAPGLRKFCGDQKHVYLDIEYLSSKMFEIILKFVYNNHSLTLNDFEDIEVSLSPLSGLDNLEVSSKFREICGLFGLAEYATISLSSQPAKPSAMRLKRTDFPELHDITINCADNQTLKAHKCILISRMEYFRMMFSNNWAETNSVNMRSVSIDYMVPMIDYLYDVDMDDGCTRHTDTFLCNMLIICDQFFVKPLDDQYEKVLIERLTLKKCSDLYDFACDFNRQYLRVEAFEFMVNNFIRLLESRLLDKMSKDVVDLICRTYRDRMVFLDEIPAGSRQSDSNLEMEVADFEVNMDYRSAKQKKQRRTSDSSQERRQMEKEAIDAMKNLNVDRRQSIGGDDKIISESPVAVEASKVSETLLAKADDWMKVIDKKDLKKRTVLVGLKSNDILASEAKCNEEFVSLNRFAKHSKDDSSGGDAFDSEGKDDDEFLDRSIPLGSFTSNITPKLSQKQRKVLLRQNSNEPLTPTSPSTSASSASAENVWLKNQSPSENTPDAQTNPTSFFDLKTQSPNPAFISPRSKRSPKLLMSPTSSSSSISSSNSSKTAFTNIVREEQRDKKNFERMKNKPLALTLMEERAIDELKKFYNVDNVPDERITIERSEMAQPSRIVPTWHNQK